MKLHAITKTAWPEGLILYPGLLSENSCKSLLDAIVAALMQAPLFVPRMPGTGKPFSVRMSNFGPLGWVSDKSKGYRYEPLHPETRQPWPEMPAILQELWAQLVDPALPPEAGLINYYAPGARMGMHVDVDEAALNMPILSISLGWTARFRIGGPRRGGSTQSLMLRHGDVLVMGGTARRCYHGIDRIYPESHVALPTEIGPGRINITLRRVTCPHREEGKKNALPS